MNFTLTSPIGGNLMNLSFMFGSNEKKAFFYKIGSLFNFSSTNYSQVNNYFKIVFNTKNVGYSEVS